MTLILSVTLAPPRIAANGRAGDLEELRQRLDLALHEQAGVGRQELRRSPTVEAWARWAVPKASLT